VNAIIDSVQQEDCSYRKCYPGANSFEINEIQEEETEVAITKRW